MLRNRFQHLLLLKYHHAFNIFIKLLFAALVHFHSVLVEESKIFCSAQRLIHNGDFRNKHFFSQMTPKNVFNLSTLRNRFQHLLLLKFHHALNIFIKLLFAALVQFYSVLVEESKIFCSTQRFIHRGDFRKKHFFHRWDQKSGFNLSTLRNRLQHSLLLKFHHGLKIFINFLFAALVHFYSVFVEESMIICSPQQFIHGEKLKRSNFFTDETKKVVLSCLRLEAGSNIYYFWSFTMHSISSSKYFLRPWCTSTPS